MEHEKVLAQLQDELTVCYEHIGRKAPSTLPIIAASLQEALRFDSPEQVHSIFMKAKDIESIPTQKTLRECMRNHAEEFLKYRDDDTATAIEYKDPRAAWLPSEDLKRRINTATAIKNLCTAISNREYSEYCRCHGTERREGRTVYTRPEAVKAFDEPKKEQLRDLYRKYWRRLPIANGYPADAPLDLGLIPPTVQQFKVMLEHEAKLDGYATAV